MRHALSEFREAFGSPIALTFTVSVFVLTTAAWLYREREKPMNWTTLLGLAVPVGASVLVVGSVLLVRASYRAFQEANDRATVAEATIAELTEKPKIDIQIKEAFIIPQKSRVAECFVRLSVQNDTDIECKLIHYSLTLRIKGADYDHISPLALDDYKLYYGKVQTTYDEYGTRCEMWATVTTAELSRVSGSFGITVRGNPLEGWIAFAVHNVPEWESTLESIGTSAHTEYDDEGNVIEEYPTDILERILHLTGVESLRVTVEDSFSQIWTQETSGPFESERTRIRFSKVDGTGRGGDKPDIVTQRMG